MHLINQLNSGIISTTEANLTRNQINATLFRIVHSITKESPNDDYTDTINQISNIELVNYKQEDLKYKAFLVYSTIGIILCLLMIAYGFTVEIGGGGIIFFTVFLLVGLFSAVLIRSN